MSKYYIPYNSPRKMQLSVTRLLRFSNKLLLQQRKEFSYLKDYYNIKPQMTITINFLQR